MSNIDPQNIRIITVSGRIGAGSTTLAKNLAKNLSWTHIEGGEIFWEAVRKKLGFKPKDTNLRPDEEDTAFDEHLKEILKSKNNLVLETKLAGYIGHQTKGIYKILVVCEDRYGQDHIDIRIDRLVNREGISVEKAKEEVIEREKNDLIKWRRLYAGNDPEWAYFDRKYYDLVINTFDHNKEEALSLALKAINSEK